VSIFWVNFKGEEYRLFDRPNQIDYNKKYIFSEDRNILYRWFNHDKIIHTIRKFMDGKREEEYYDNRGNITKFIEIKIDGTIMCEYVENGFVTHREIQYPSGITIDKYFKNGKDNHIKTQYPTGTIIHEYFDDNGNIYLRKTHYPDGTSGTKDFTQPLSA
jgi:hypothetical protein